MPGLMEYLGPADPPLRDELEPPRRRRGFGAAGLPPDPTVSQLERGLYDTPVSAHLIGAPTISGVSYNPDTITASSYDPTTIKAPTEALYTLGPSAFESLSLDPDSRLTQMHMLAEMQRAYAQGGFTDTERANIENLLLHQRQAQTAGAMGAYQEADRRGLGTSATALAASLFASQQVAQTASNQALQIAQQAEAARTQLRGEISGLAGNIRGMDYKIASDRASAIDAVNKFNVDNKQQWAARAASQEMSARSFNASAKNEANRFAAQQSQSAAAFNAGETNTANRFAAQTGFEAQKSNAEMAFQAAAHNSSQSFAAEQYNRNQAFQTATFRKGIEERNVTAENNRWKDLIELQKWNYDHPGGLEGKPSESPPPAPSSQPKNPQPQPPPGSNPWEYPAGGG